MGLIQHTTPLHPSGRIVLAAVVTWAVGTVTAAPVNIVTTTSDLASIAQAIGGAQAKVSSICAGNEDPHFLQAKPSYIVKARKAELWIRVGLELEIGWEPEILRGARNRCIREGTRGHLDASERIVRLQVPTTRVTRAWGDVHPAGNPHYWLDPLNGRIVAESIANRLAELRPEQAAIFRKNLAAFQKRLDDHMFGKELVAEVGGAKLWALQREGKVLEVLEQKGLTGKLGGWLGKLAPFQGAKIVTFHRSWTYFASRFGLVVADELEPKPGIPPSPKHLVEVVRRVKADKIKVLLMEPFYPRKPADLVARRSGIQVLVCANCVGGQREARDYVALISLIVDQVSRALAE